MLHFNVLVLACFSFCFYRLKILLSPLASTPTDWWAISREEEEDMNTYFGVQFLLEHRVIWLWFKTSKDIFDPYWFDTQFVNVTFNLGLNLPNKNRFHGILSETCLENWASIPKVLLKLSLSMKNWGISNFHFIICHIAKPENLEIAKVPGRNLPTNVLVLT